MLKKKKLVLSKAKLYEKIGQDQVKCIACAHYCRIVEGRTGVCGVRMNYQGDLYLMVYGKASAVNIDPIEKKPLFHFLPGTEIFSFGTVGCNFACDFCQNWDLSQSAKEVQKKAKDKDERMLRLGKLVDYGQELPPHEIVKYCLKNKIPSIAYTYNEPVIFFEYLYDTAKLAHSEGVKNIFVSNGYESEEAMNKIHPYLDAMNVDLKSFNEEFYNKTCKAHLEPVLKTIKRAHDMGIWIEVTTLVIPGENDSDEELESIAKFIADVSTSVPWHVTAFTPNYKMDQKPSTSPESLQKAYKIGKSAGLKYVYTGNVFDDECQNTYCPSCNHMNIGRDWHSVTKNEIGQGKCSKCGTDIEGIWQ
ncbi:AmmeMemoRadiSam system radical SAM enzyme [Patescibacteria group bacterium]|nr:AmmeMemoRadiSam system radical SAM enzyme [Patescibacteria group bacterium]